MAAANNFEICSTLQALQSYLLSVVGKYLKKLALLQRLATLMEQAGDLIQIPDLANLIPLGLLDATNYNQIRCACPFLGLPDLSSTEQELSDLKQLVQQGYQALDALLAGHPYARLNQLQDQLDQLLAEIEQAALSAIDPGMDVLGCLNALCNGIDQLEAYTVGFVNTATSDFEGIATTPNTVLNSAQQTKSNLITTGRATLSDLMS